MNDVQEMETNSRRRKNDAEIITSMYPTFDFDIPSPTFVITLMEFD